MKSNPVLKKKIMRLQCFYSKDRKLKPVIRKMSVYQVAKKQMATFEIPAEEASGQWLSMVRSRHQYTLCRTSSFSSLTLAWENIRQFATLPLVSRPNDVWLSSAEIPYWWRITTQTQVVSRHQYRISALVSQTPFLRLLCSLPCPSVPGKVKRQTWSTDMKIV